ncbi:hypothetical protein LZZ85_19885 [Terrimonas sp. NA20]|uniref:Cell surface protein SprA n=1 Tax=Terrimonas ginsenosidimutans TaxID=2908004 RepID=A0ABS9KW88_9BACT|nr:hypothetical protein [Terrimonas ginsenosidimutans]MCG2616570.1 hypothetical protein [Terrimonas ginsenosidimutans]
MSVLRRIYLLFPVLLLSMAATAQIPAQSRSNLRVKKTPVLTDTLRLDTLSIIPNTFNSPGIDSADYRLDFINGLLIWKKRPLTDSILVSYRVFNYKLNPVAQRMPYDSVKYNIALEPYEFNSELSDAQKGIFNFGSLKAEGSFGRQIAFGNAQDAVLNSTLNLQLSGMLGDSIEIQAAITDNNIPLQPDGTTQQLNEFDQVFLQFKKKNWQLNLGDIDIRQNQSYFLNFYKRLQGVSFQTINKIGEKIESRTLVSGSIAKGKFTRNIIDNTNTPNLEGNQGPYRLTGANNEFFFIILANTERVFIDGQLLQRGEDQDYVINYNTAELTFTPKRMITKDSRIQVEFEYADRNYLNANFYASQELDINRKLKIRIGAFTNSDAKNSQINQVLSPEQKQFLGSIGDSIQRAYYPSAVIDTFAAGKILYEKIYFTGPTGVDSFYQYSTNTAVTLYNLSFALVGQGNGNYVPEFNGANGKVYTFVQPVNGVKQGSYEAASLLVTPKQQQLVNLGVDYNITENTLVRTEVAMSRYDPNTFSSVDNGDDQGYAAKVQLNNLQQLKASSKLQLATSLDYEYVQAKFRPLERLRTVEFSRDWGLPIQIIPQTENIIRASAGLKDNRNHAFTYRFINYRRGTDYNGYQNALVHTANWKGWEFNNEFVATNFNAAIEKGLFLRPTFDLSKQFKQFNNWKLGFRYALEKNTVKDKATDTLTYNAFWFDSYSIYLRSDPGKRNRYNATFFTREDKYLVGKDFLDGDRSYNLNLQAELLSNPNRQLYLNTTFRKLNVRNAAISKQTEDETILGRAEYVMNEWKGLLTGNVLYEVGAGQEQRRDIAYVEVPAGTGQYAWIDYNSDGTQQLNEFELAVFADQAKFIRIFTPTNEFIKSNYITFNYSISLNPKAVFNKPGQKGFKGFVARFNFITSLQINKKSIAQGSFEFNPFKYGVTDTNLVTLNTVLTNTISFNRFNTTWGVDFSNLRNNGKSLLTYGYESRELNDWSSRIRWNFSRALSLNIVGRLAANSLFTPNSQFDNRNYELDIQSVEPVFSLIRGTSMRIATGYKFEHKKNKPVYGGEAADSHSFNLESKYNVLQNSSLTGKFTFNNISYSGGTAATTVSYIMLDGLLPGKNFLWSLTLTKRLLNNLELNFQYDGRRPAASRTVHTGKASLTALF